MLKYLVLGLGLLATPAVAQEGLNFDSAQLCAWQSANNGMDAGECAKLEDEAKTAVADLEATVDADRKSACMVEAKGFSGDSGFASYTLYAGCLKDGPGNL
jgi:hypothetical protein